MQSVVFKDVKVKLNRATDFVVLWPTIRQALKAAGIPQFRIDRIYKEAVKLSRNHAQVHEWLESWVCIEWAE